MASYTLHIQYVDRPAETRTFTQPKVTLGRDSGDIVLHDTQVSGRHGEITFDGSTLRYTDVGSTNGSFLLQGQRVANIELTPGIALRLGNSLITVQVIDAPNVAGKGRTVIAGPGMAPGFPAPVRPPSPLSAATPIPRPSVPAPPPGAFAFAPTAQMQSPLAPGAHPMAPPQPGAFVPQPAPTPAAPAYPQPPQPFAAPQPAAPAPPGPPPGTLAGGPRAAPPAPMAPAPMAPAPMNPAPMNPAPMHAAPQPVAAAVPAAPPSIMPAMPTGADTPAIEPPGDEPAPGDLVGQIKALLLRGLQVFSPVAVGAVLLVAAVYVPISLVAHLGLMILPLSLASILALLLTLVQLAALLIVMPALYRYVIGAYLGQPVDLRATVNEMVPKAADVIVNCDIPAIVLGVFAGPIYWVEGKKLGDVIGRNFNLLGKNLVPILLSIFGVGVVATLIIMIPSYILAYLPLGGLLAALWGNVVMAVVIAYFVAFSVATYFDMRRRFEGGDPEGEARARLASIALPPG